MTLAACSLPSANVQSAQTPVENSAETPAGTQTQTSAKPKRNTPARRRGPVVLEAQLSGDGEHLRLQLSKPISPTEGVDPNDFRLSIAMVYMYMRYAYAQYYDPGDYLGETLMQFTALRANGDTLELDIDPAFEIAYCMEIERDIKEMQSEPGVRAKGGVFLHYAPGERAITDVGGDAMAAFAAEWVLLRRRDGDEAYEMYFEGPEARRALREAIPVRCGPDLPPGPR